MGEDIGLTFRVAPRILILSSLFIYPTDAQINCSKRMLKFTLKFTLKFSYMFRFYKHRQGAKFRASLKL